MNSTPIPAAASNFPIQGRVIVLLLILSIFYVPGSESLILWLGVDADVPLSEAVYNSYAELLFVTVIVLLIRFTGVNWRAMFSRPEAGVYPGALLLTLFIFLFSMATVYALFLPLSYIVPEFVTLWLIDLPPIIYYSPDNIHLLANTMFFILIVILVPIIEELVFRGLLLHRWTQKWTLMRAMIVSSLLFAFLHPDPIGAFAFGMAMSYLYLKTGTLIVPIICHAANNLVAWLIEAGYLIALGPDIDYSLEDFQKSWLFGAISGVIVIVWAVICLRGSHSRQRWSLPSLRDAAPGNEHD